MGTPLPMAPHQQRLGKVGQLAPQESSQGAEEDDGQTEQQHGHWPLSNQLGIARKEEESPCESVLSGVGELRSHQEGVVGLYGAQPGHPKGPEKAWAYLFGIWKARSCLWKRRKDTCSAESSCRVGGGGGEIEEDAINLFGPSRSPAANPYFYLYPGCLLHQRQGTSWAASLWSPEPGWLAPLLSPALPSSASWQAAGALLT